MTLTLTDPDALAVLLRDAFDGLPLVLRATRDACPEDWLTPGERKHLAGMRAPSRRRSWLLGRRLLKSMWGVEADTTQMRLPRPDVSLAHSGPWAVAVFLEDPEAFGVRGLGVDFEGPRWLSPEAGRFYLTPDELAWLKSRPNADEAAKEALRLWTIKEAVFKSDPDNAGRLLSEYALVEPFELADWARRPGDYAPRVRVATLALDEGPLSVALTVGPVPASP